MPGKTFNWEVDRLPDCLFCKIASKEIDSAIVFEDERVIAIKDIKPLAPVHILLIPKRHLDSLARAGEQDIPLLGYIQYRARELARELGLDGNFKVVTNCGEQCGQTIMHMHYHLLGGAILDQELA